MFRLQFFELKNHPILGNLELDFTNRKLTNSEQPYTSVIIGMNGTGKSHILKTIADLFNNIDRLLTKDKRDRISFQFHLRYELDNDVYDLVSSNFIYHEHKSLRKKNIDKIYALKNRPRDARVYDDETFEFSPDSEYRIELEKDILPNRVIASTTQLNDRFTFKNNEADEVYQYLGVKRTAQIISTKSFERNTASYIYEAIKNEGFVSRLKNILKYLGFKNHLKIIYKTKYTSKFFNDDISVDFFYKFYHDWENTTTRKSEPWGKWSFDQIDKKEPKKSKE